LPWQQGQSEPNLSDTLKCADSEYPLTGAGIWVVCLIQPEL